MQALFRSRGVVVSRTQATDPRSKNFSQKF